MKLLLATHALLWFLADDPRLSASARTTIEDPANPRLLSPVSLQEIPGARQMVPQSSASTTARSLRAVRSWVTGRDGLTQATLLTQTRAPSGERLQTSWKRSRIPTAHENGRGLDRGCPAALFNPAVEWPPGNLAARWSTSTGAPTQRLLQYINPHSMASLFGLLYPSSRPGHDLIRFFAARSCTLRKNRSDPASGVAPVLVSTALARATSGTRTLDVSFTKAALYQLS